MTNYMVTYNTTTGKIIQAAEWAGTEEEWDNELIAASYFGEDVSLIAYESDICDPNALYVSDGAVLEKTEFPSLTYGNGTIHNIPEGTVVVWPDDLHTTVDDGVVEITSNVSTVFEFTFYHPKYLQKEVTVAFDVA